MSQDYTGAGIIIFSRKISENEEIKYLTLRVGKKIDLPKGGIDMLDNGQKEDPLFAAIRETKEECSLRNVIDYKLIKDFECESGERLIMFLAESTATLEDPYRNVEIVENKKTRIKEHDDANWLSLKEIFSGEFGNLYSYLNKPLLIAENYIINM